MKIEIKRFPEGAKQAKGLAVVIDVIRASTTIASLLDKGAEKIIVVVELEDALALKKENPDFTTVGERLCLKPKGFDYGNSPVELEKVDFKGKTVVMSTTNGTKGIVNAKNADEIILGSFVNFKATFNYIKEKNPKILSLIALGSNNVNAPEDDIFAEYLKAKLENKIYDLSSLNKKVMKSRSVRIATRAGYGKDVDYCLKFNVFNIVPKVFKENGLLVIRNAG